MKKGFTGLAIKNYSHQLKTTLIAKLSGLIFTVLIARLLLPELFGVYTLVLSIVLIIVTLTDLGINSTSVRYISQELGKKNKIMARSYFKYLLKIKSLITVTVILLTILFAKILANNILNKPIIFLPLIVSCVFIFLNSFNGLFLSLFYSLNKREKLPIIEAITQIVKITFSVLAAYLLSDTLKISGIFLAYALAITISLTIFITIIRKKDKYLLVGKTIKIEKHKLLNYLSYMSLASISLVFFGSIDSLMLGRFVNIEYLGFYRVALSLALTVATLMTISGIILPLFTRMNEERIKKAFRKVSKYTVMITIPATVGLILISKQIILAIYGTNYLQAQLPLIFLAPLIITFPLIALYSTIFESRENSKILAKYIIQALILNIILNIILIKSLLQYGDVYVITGVGFATLISRIYYLNRLSKNAKKKFNIKIKKKPIIQSTIGSIIMGGFMIGFDKLFEVKIILGLIEIILAILVYIGIMWIIKGIIKEDINLIKNNISKT
jgi:stage V sporulation protein B